MSAFYSDKLEIGIIGQGNLANFITDRLVNAEFSINVLENQNNNELNSKIRIYNKPVALARACSIIITLLSDGPELEEILFGDQGIVQCRRTDIIVIDMSSVSPEFISELSEQLVENEISFLDAAVINEETDNTGAIQMILVGGEASVYEQVLPIFQRIARSVKHIGANGASQFYRQAFAVRKKST